METALESLRKALAMKQRRRSAAPLPPVQYPLVPQPRIAVLGAELRGPSGTHCFPSWSAENLRRLRPQALAGWWNDLAEVARLVLAGELELPQLQFPILVFSRPESSPLPPRCHDLLWDWFRVPTFEQIRAAGGRLLAYECMARCGFHLAPQAEEASLPLVRTGRLCACGDPAPLACAEGLATAAAG
ncbi:MAG: hypothetical protein WHT08_00395 [Bryobacteraceae bacterium]